MNYPEREQLFLEDLAEQQSGESFEGKSVLSSSSELGQEKEDCKVCGDSGPCSACERGRELAKKQGRAYRKKSN